MAFDVTAIPKLIDTTMDTIKNLVTNAEERGKAIAALTTAKAQATNVVLDYHARLFEAQSKIVEAEAKSEHTITAVWRPVLMLSFGFVVVWNLVMPTLGLRPLDPTSANLTPELWALLKLGIGGYVIGRSGEKIVKSASEAFKTSSMDLMKPAKLAKLKQKLAEIDAAA